MGLLIWGALLVNVYLNFGFLLFHFCCWKIKEELMSLSQGSLNVSQYLTKLNGLWEEPTDHHPIHNSSCGRIQPVLMGLIDSFFIIRCQILLTDPIPPINKVFTLSIQEEKQREVGSFMSDPTVQTNFCCSVQNSNSMPNLDGKSKSHMKDQPLCTHCGILGHTKDKCYKLHGYPPSYKKLKHQCQSGNVNQIFNNSVAEFSLQLSTQRCPCFSLKHHRSMSHISCTLQIPFS